MIPARIVHLCWQQHGLGLLVCRANSVVEKIWDTLDNKLQSIAAYETKTIIKTIQMSSIPCIPLVAHLRPLVEFSLEVILEYSYYLREWWTVVNQGQRNHSLYESSFQRWTATLRWSTSQVSFEPLLFVRSDLTRKWSLWLALLGPLVHDSRTWNLHSNFSVSLGVSTMGRSEVLFISEGLLSLLDCSIFFVYVK